MVGFCLWMHPPVYLARHLHEKHPDPGVIDESAFMPCDDLPPLLDLDITADYVERVAHQIQGSSGPCESTALQWHGYLLHCGVSSARLRDAVAMLARHLQMKLWIGRVYML